MVTIQRTTLFVSFLLLWVVGCNGFQKSGITDAELAIVGVLAQGRYLSPIMRNPSLDRKQEVVARLKTIDLSNCPRDFAEAYANHVRAWERKIKEYTRLVAQNRTGGIVTLEIRAEVDPSFSKNISSTWNQVKQLAGKYGVTYEIDW